MNFLFSGLFWGLILVLIGISVIIKAVFKIDIPIVRLIFALILIYFGLKMLLGGFRIGTERTIIFQEAELKAGARDSEYNIIFGSGEINISDLKLEDRIIRIEADIIFGSGKVLLPAGIPVIVKTSTVFGQCRLPDAQTSAFGDRTYRSPGIDTSQPYLILELDVVFGSAEIIII